MARYISHRQESADLHLLTGPTCYRDFASRIICVGLIRDRQIWQPEMLFEVIANRTRDEILSRLQDASEQEHSAIEWCANDPEALSQFMTHTGLLAPVALGSMLLHGWDRWGPQWIVHASKSVTQNEHTEKYRAKS